MKKYFILLSFTLTLFIQSTIAFAAKVTCNFDTGEKYGISDGAWQGSMGMESLWEMFGMEGLTLPLENSLLAKLDTEEIFIAGNTDKGDVYLAGSEDGIYGRMTTILNGSIVIYSGYCDVGFGD